MAAYLAQNFVDHQHSCVHVIKQRVYAPAKCRRIISPDAHTQDQRWYLHPHALYTLRATSYAPSPHQDARDGQDGSLVMSVQPLRETVVDRTAHARALGLQLDMLSTTPISSAVVSSP